MSNVSLFRLVALSAIWGASFLFMRIGAPVLGPTLLIEFRVGLAALFLLVVGWVLKKALNAREHWRHYLVLGLFNSALPFLLFAYAAQTISASLLSILNATAPIWGAVIGAVWTKTPLTARASLGLALGIAGVALLAGFDPITMLPGAGLAVAAALGASFCYGISSVYAKSAKSVEPFANAHGSMWAATLLIAPAVPFFPAAEAASGTVIGSVIALGVMCSGVAYLLYFRLIADIGAAPALTVTFLIPVFGIIWGNLFLNEAIGWHTIAGSVVVIVGTALVTGFSFERLKPAPSLPPPRGGGDR
ncbi:MAG: DMT family transporter [Rhodocyclaceae bacterium]|jgi:drug/metabolite transporter (DMT)-like permease|nr:DMT family transporter [Rhodocyclaceae bacterium]